MKTYLRLLGFARPLGWVFPQYAGLIFLHTIFRIVNFTALIPVLQILFNLNTERKAVTTLPPFSVSDQYFIDVFYYYFGSIIQAEGKVAALYFICYVLVASVFLSNLFQYLSALLLARVRVNTVTNLRNRVFGHITSLHLGYFTENRKGDLMSRITTDVQQIEESVISTLKVIIKEPFLIIGYFIALMRMSAELTLYTLLLIPISGGIISYLAKRLKKRARKTQQSLGRMTGILDETLSGMRIIKAFAARSYIMGRFADEVGRYGKQNFNIAIRSNLVSPISEFLGVLFISVILLIGGKMVLSETSTLDAAQFIIFLILFSQILNPAKAISSAFNNIQRGIASGERVFEILDTRPRINDKESPRDADILTNAIEFRGVSFAYEKKTVLKDIDFSIPKGKVIALVGPSGGGKSTIAELIPRFYDPIEGQILLDSTDIRDISLKSLRQQMGIVSQESVLFNDTVFQNIAFGKPDSKIEDVENAARIANAHEFIVQLPDGYHTFIGDRGGKLSGGQRQRLSIARAVLKNPPILILDEATSALDSESEKLVQEALYNLMKNRTTLVIAHRLSTIQNADEIIVIKSGKIIQRGTHTQLLESGGMYNKLIKIQTV